MMDKITIFGGSLTLWTISDSHTRDAREDNVNKAEVQVRWSGRPNILTKILTSL